jgi:hypothetical protein
LPGETGATKSKYEEESPANMLLGSGDKFTSMNKHHSQDVNDSIIEDVDEERKSSKGTVLGESSMPFDKVHSHELSVHATCECSAKEHMSIIEEVLKEDEFMNT